MIFDLAKLNYVAVLVGALLYMAFGALYFSPVLFGNTWTKLNNLTRLQPTSYVGSTVAAFLSSFLIAVIVRATGAGTIAAGLEVGISVGLLVAFAYLKNSLFGMASPKVAAIAVGDHLIAFTLLAVLHAVWQ